MIKPDMCVSNPTVLGPPVSSKSLLPTGNAPDSLRSTKPSVCIYVSVGQASELAELAHVSESSALSQSYQSATVSRVPRPTLVN